MKRFWNQNNEAKAVTVATFLSILGFGGTAFLFWFHRYDVPLAVLVGGSVVALTWLALYLTKKSEKPHVKIDIALIYIRLAIIVSLTILFTILAINSIVIVSPIIMVISYFVVSIIAMIVYLKKGERDV